MKGICLILFAGGLLGTMGFYRLALWKCLLLVSVILIALYQLHILAWTAWVWGALVLVVGAVGLIPPLRYRCISAPLLTWFRKILPPMSTTEREAIEAGNVGWEKDLFQGTPDWKTLLALPSSSLSQEEQHFVDNQVEKLCEQLNDWEIVHKRSDLSVENWNYIKQERFFGIIIPKQYGGLGFSVRAHSEIIAKIGTRSISAAVTVMVPNSLGPAELLMHYGTEEQKNTYLPRLAKGEEIPCFALTSTEAGSDAGAMIDKGIVCRAMHEGKEVIGLRLTFEKRYITLAPVATLVGVAFKMYDPEHILGDTVDIGITLALIPASHPGMEIGDRHFPLNLAFMNGPIRAHDMFIPLEWIIGGAERAGQGWRMLMECLSAGRGISLPALSTATGMLSTRMTSAYASIRRQFKLPIIAFEGVEESFARILMNTYKLQATRLFTATSIEVYGRPSVATAMAKYHMTQMSREVINDAMDIHGGRGIMLGPKNYLGRGYQSMPVSITVEGANILTRNLMIFGQGAIRCHPFAKDEMEAALRYPENSKASLKQFDTILFKHVGYFISNTVRCIVYALTKGGWHRVPAHDVSACYLKYLTWLSTGLAVASDMSLLVLGGDLKRRERLSARLGDVLSELYMASACIKYFYDNGKLVSEESILKGVLQLACFRIQEAFYGFFENAPHFLLRHVLKWIIFPFGKRFSFPSDKLQHRIIKSFFEEPRLRESLTALCYYNNTKNDPTGLMEKTYNTLLVVKPLLQKLNEAVKQDKSLLAQDGESLIQWAKEHHILTAQEAAQLIEYESLRKQSLSVDQFSENVALGVVQHA